MNLGRIEGELQKLFSRSSLEDWKNIATEETGGENPFEKLSWRGKDGLLFLPYYDASTQPARIGPQIQKEKRRQHWFNLPLVKLRDPRAANALALEHLMQGADGVVCDVRTVTDPDINTVTNNIEWAHCYLGFYIDDNQHFLRSLSSVLQDEDISSKAMGALFWESIPKEYDFGFYFDVCPLFSALGLLIPSSSPAEEISAALIKGVRTVETFRDRATAGNIFRSICFSVSADATLLETIAKFRALRMLWLQVAHAYGIDNYAPDALFLHARSESVGDDKFGPHENMLKGTFAAMAALMGGCDALTIEDNETGSFTTRSARNVSSILREESFFDRHADPVAGAWAIESLTNAIAAKSWDLFQKKWKADGTT